MQRSASMPHKPEAELLWGPGGSTHTPASPQRSHVSRSLAAMAGEEASSDYCTSFSSSRASSFGSLPLLSDEEEAYSVHGSVEMGQQTATGQQHRSDAMAGIPPSPLLTGTLLQSHNAATASNDGDTSRGNMRLFVSEDESGDTPDESRTPTPTHSAHGGSFSGNLTGYRRGKTATLDVTAGVNGEASELTRSRSLDWNGKRGPAGCLPSATPARQPAAATAACRTEAASEPALLDALASEEGHSHQQAMSPTAVADTLHRLRGQPDGTATPGRTGTKHADAVGSGSPQSQGSLSPVLSPTPPQRRGPAFTCDLSFLDVKETLV